MRVDVYMNVRRKMESSLFSGFQNTKIKLTGNLHCGASIQFPQVFSQIHCILSAGDFKRRKYFSYTDGGNTSFGQSSWISTEFVKKALQYFGAGLPSMKRPGAKLTSPIGTVKFCTLIAVQHLELKAGKKIKEEERSYQVGQNSTSRTFGTTGNQQPASVTGRQVSSLI